MRAVRASVVAGVAATAMMLAACSSSGTSSRTPAGTGGSTASSLAPEDITTTAAAVSDGLAKLVVLSKDIATRTARSSDDGKEAAEGLEPLWRPIEGTVKKNDADTYLSIEDAFAGLESGNSAQAATAAADLSRAVTSYVAKYSG
jgi:hypothetical protein